MIKAAVVYSTRTGNTAELAQYVYERLKLQFDSVVLKQMGQFSLDQLTEYDAIVIGTYSWGDGEIPPEMLPLYEAFENQRVKHLITGVVGTGDSFYPRFCGAVDEFRDMLYVRTDLVATLKVELSPQGNDFERCNQFVELFRKRVTD